ncbi:unnamed protein product, partial [Mesorhabditis belari]|uniref:TIL domain-containing protein n=1 Tax=Mesorhabditis belari TaxID=2138241 RepID=A0AAF3F4V0_9BILA
MIFFTEARTRSHGSRKHRSMPIFPYRNEKSASSCGPREHHVKCGPEKHCEKSCENLYSPPNCEHDMTNPKCYFPRCLCNDGFVRDENGRCIRPSKCSNNVVEQTEIDGGDVEFRSLRHSHLRARRRNHKKRQNNYFW